MTDTIERKANATLREIVGQSEWFAVSRRGIRTLRSAKKHSVGTIMVTESGELRVTGQGAITEILGFYDGEIAMRFDFGINGNVEFLFTPQLTRS